jgi:pseudouridine kinase
MDRRIGPFHSITVFGGATVDRIAVSGGPPVMGASNPGNAQTFPGGVGLNVAAALARLGHEVRLVGRIGADQDGETVVAAAGAAGLDTTFLGVSPTAPTGGYHAAFDDRGGLVIGIADMGIYDEMSPLAVSPAAAQSPIDDLWVVDANLPRRRPSISSSARRRKPAGRLWRSPSRR